jgi:hypothetical protein
MLHSRKKRLKYDAFGGCSEIWKGLLSHLELVTLVVWPCQTAIDFFTNIRQFELVENVPSWTNDGRPKGWLVVRPAASVTGILLARADGEQQANIVGQQFAGRVGSFLRLMIRRCPQTPG